MRRDDEPIAAEIVVAAGPLKIPAEIFPANATEFQKALSKLVEQKVAEAISGGDSTFEPWFRTKSVSNEIRKIQTVREREKFSRYFEKWGCLICETKETRHCALGMCQGCHGRTRSRLDAIIRDSTPKEPPVFQDTAKLAKEAVEPSIEKLVAGESARPQLYTTPQAARLIGVDQSTIRDWLIAGKIDQPEKIGHDYRWSAQQLETLRALAKPLKDRSKNSQGSED